MQGVDFKTPLGQGDENPFAQRDEFIFLVLIALRIDQCGIQSLEGDIVSLDIPNKRNTY